MPLRMRVDTKRDTRMYMCVDMYATICLKVRPGVIIDKHFYRQLYRVLYFFTPFTYTLNSPPVTSPKKASTVRGSPSLHFSRIVMEEETMSDEAED